MAIKYNLQVALKMIQKDCRLIEDILDEASFGQDAIDMVKDYIETDHPYVLIFMDCSM